MNTRYSRAACHRLTSAARAPGPDGERLEIQTKLGIVADGNPHDVAAAVRSVSLRDHLVGHAPHRCRAGGEIEPPGIHMHGERGVGGNDVTNAVQTERLEALRNGQHSRIRGFIHRRSDLDEECGVSERQNTHGASVHCGEADPWPACDCCSASTSFR